MTYRSKLHCQQEGKNQNSKYFFYSRVVVFGSETYCFAEIAINYVRFSNLLLKNFTTGFIYQKSFIMVLSQ